MSSLKTERPTVATPAEGARHTPRLGDLWEMSAADRRRLLGDEAARVHRHHYLANAAYRRSMRLRGVGEELPAGDDATIARLLRPTAATFKSYVDIIGTPFPNDRPREFLDWLADQLSLSLPAARTARIRARYGSLESLLRAIEATFSDLGLELLTSSGTSGRASIIARDPATTDVTVESFYLCFQRYFGMSADHRLVFLMPRRTRIAMAVMARFSATRIGLDGDRVHYAIPFPAFPDHVRIRTGRTYRFDRRGVLERHLWHPFMERLQEAYVDPHTTRRALSVLDGASRRGEKVLLVGSLAQLHRVALALKKEGRCLELAPGSLLGTGGGMKELYAATPDEIRADTSAVVRLRGGEPVPIRDSYGMAEANWVAMQCSAGNYHVPPWVWVMALDDDDRPLPGRRATGMLAFCDPLAGGTLYPPFFRTADRVTLVRPWAVGREVTDGEDVRCPCGEDGAYILRSSIQRVDRLEEAGCAAQM